MENKSSEKMSFYHAKFVSTLTNTFNRRDKHDFLSFVSTYFWNQKVAFEIVFWKRKNLELDFQKC